MGELVEDGSERRVENEKIGGRDLGRGREERAVTSGVMVAVNKRV